jgi:hypothetical protein
MIHVRLFGSSYSYKPALAAWHLEAKPIKGENK